VLNAHDLAEEFGHLPLRLMEKMNIHGRVEHVELLVDEERLRSAELIRRLPRAVTQNVSDF